MLRKRLYTFIVAGNSGGRIWRLSVPFPVIVAAGIMALVGLIAVGAGTLSYGRMILKVVDYENRISENDSLRTENHSYKVQTAQLGEKIDFLENISRKLEVFSGMRSPKAPGGIGGVASDNLSTPRPISQDPLASITAYNKKVTTLEESIRALDNHITEKVLSLAAQPSLMPVRGYITAGMGRRPDPFNPSQSESHPGVDISAQTGARIIAPADGTVIFAGQRAGYGNMVIIDHKFGITTRYAHLQRISVQVGQHVSRTDILGYVGSSGKTTGPHLHYEVWYNSRPVNPARFFPEVG